MDTSPQTTTLPSTRTFAKDVEARRQNNSSRKASAEPLSNAGQPEVVSKKEENHVYQAPTWKKRQVEVAAPKPARLKEIPPIKANIKTEPPKVTKIPFPKKADNEEAMIVDNEDAAEAVIIRDTKYNRFRLFPAIGSSLKRWFLNFKDNHFSKKVAKYTVPDATLRKGVIQKATSKTGTVATSDHASLHERIRERQNRTAPKTPVTIWTANTEPAYLLLEPGETVSNVKIEPRKSFRITEIQETPEKKSDPKPNLEPVLVPSKETPEVATIPAKLPTPKIPVPISIPKEIKVESIPPPIEVGVAEEAKEKRGLRYWLFSTDTNFMSLGVAGLVLAVVTTLAVLAMWFRGQIDIPDQTLTQGPKGLIEVPLELVYADEMSREMLSKLINTKLTGDGLHQFRQVAISADEEGLTKLPAPFVFEAMEFDVNAVFQNSITATYFGRTAEDVPFIILKVVDATTARGGMLAWESSLYTDTKPVLDTQIDSSKIEDIAFTDDVIAGVDTRVLAAESVYLTYAIAKDNIVIITTNSDVLEELISKLK